MSNDQHPDYGYRVGSAVVSEKYGVGRVAALSGDQAELSFPDSASAKLTVPMEHLDPNREDPLYRPPMSEKDVRHALSLIGSVPACKGNDDFVERYQNWNDIYFSASINELAELIAMILDWATLNEAAERRSREELGAFDQLGKDKIGKLLNVRLATPEKTLLLNCIRLLTVETAATQGVRRDLAEQKIIRQARSRVRTLMEA